MVCYVVILRDVSMTVAETVASEDHYGPWLMLPALVSTVIPTLVLPVRSF